MPDVKLADLVPAATRAPLAAIQSLAARQLPDTVAAEARDALVTIVGGLWINAQIHTEQLELDGDDFRDVQQAISVAEKAAGDHAPLAFPILETLTREGLMPDVFTRTPS